MVRGLLHPGQVEGKADKPGILATQHRPHALIPDTVQINFSLCIFESVKIRRHFLQVLDNDIFRQDTVDPHKYFVYRQKAAAFEACDLMDGMHTRIRATGRDDGYLLAGDLCYGFFQDLLNGDAIELSLPAAIGCTVISENHFEITHHV